MALTVTVAPATTPGDLAPAKLQVNEDGSTFDDLVNIWIPAAVAAFEESAGRSLITRTYRLTVEAASEIRLLRPPLLAVASVVVTLEDGTAETLVVNTDYTLSTVLAAWPLITIDDLASTAETVAVTYTAGYGASAADVPADFRAALLCHIQAAYGRRPFTVDERRAWASVVDRYRASWGG